MRPIALRLERSIRISKRGVIQERAQHLVMAVVRFVRSRNDDVDDTQSAGRANALVRYPITRTHDTVARQRVLERAHDGCADRDDPSAPISRPPDGRCRRLGNAIGLVERKPPVELGITG